MTGREIHIAVSPARPSTRKSRRTASGPGLLSKRNLSLLLLPACLFAFSLLPAVLNAGDPPENDAGEAGGTTVITAEEISKSGLTRLHELFHLLDNWNGVSINGQDWRIGARGPGSGEETGPLILIDGHPVAIHGPGWHSFNHLPVTLAEIEKVIAIDRPVLHEGYFADRGLIHIVTSRGNPGWNADLRFSAGNEINDPGPFEFTPLRSPNEERLGPDMDLLLGYRSEHWYLRGTASTLRHRSTDTPIERRIKEMLRFEPDRFEEPTNLKKAFHLAAGFESGRNSLELRAGGGDHQELPFIAAWGREMPVRLQSLHGGLRFEHSLTESTRLAVRSTLQRLIPGEMANRDGFRFDFRESVHTHRISILRSVDGRDLSAGWMHESVGVEGRFEQQPGAPSGSSFYGSWSEPLGSHLRLTAQAHLAYSDERWYPGLSLDSSWKLAGGQTLHNWISVSQRTPWRSRNLGYWMREGYEGFTSPELGPWSPAEPSAPSLFSAGSRWNATLSNRVQLLLEAALFRHRELSFARYDYDLILPYQWFGHDGARSETDASATLLRFGATARIRTLPGLEHTLYAGLLGVPESTGAAGELFAELPRRVARIETRWEPVEGFRLWGRLRAASAAEWAEFSRVDGAQIFDQQSLDDTRISMRTGPLTNIDAGGSKSLWSERMTLELILKNLLNQPWLLHPAGTDHELTFYIQLRLHL